MMTIVKESTLRLTDATWIALGMAAECLGITRADLQRTGSQGE